MIAHISIGVRDIDISKRFYDTVLEPLGYKCLRAARTLQGYGYGRDSIALWVVQAEHPVPTDEKSGLHFCFAAENAAAQSMHFTLLRCAQVGKTTVRPVCARFAAPTTTLPSSSIQTDTASKHITVQARPEVSRMQCSTSDRATDAITA
jgi:catechol 2,3-dioxygenase-like lactoylglutathione lyase family enzyme